MTNRQCPVCPTGYLAMDRDMYGEFIHCLMCGWNSDRKRAGEDSVSSLLEFRGSRRADSFGANAPSHSPTLASWTGAVLTARKHQKPRYCIWSDCRTHPDSRDHCCSVSSAPYPYCNAHISVYRAELDQNPPHWKEMCLNVPYGIVHIEYLVENRGSARDKGHALAQKVELPGSSALSAAMKHTVLTQFRQDTGLTLMWLDEAIAATLPQLLHAL